MVNELGIGDSLPRWEHPKTPVEFPTTAKKCVYIYVWIVDALYSKYTNLLKKELVSFAMGPYQLPSSSPHAVSLPCMSGESTC